MSNLEVLSIDFFRYYDQLDQEASSLEEATSALREAKEKRDKAQTELLKNQKELRKLGAFIKEQKERISLVTTHWFYGTTLLQPQLWFRGGCQGKIGRAKVKLEKAQESDLPVLQTTIQQLQEDQLPPLQRAVDFQLERFESSANASSTQQSMRERAYSEYPSPQLLQLQGQSKSLKLEIDNFQNEASNLDNVIAQLVQGQNQYKHARKLLNQALKHNETCDKLKKTPVPIPVPLQILNNSRGNRTETMVADGTKIVVINQKGGTKDIFHLKKNGKVLSTNFPCPGGCGHLVTWHGTHCCGACQNGRGGHGKRCERKPLSTQQGAQQKLRKMEKETAEYSNRVTKENDTSNQKFTKGRKEAKEAERTVRQALSAISLSIRERYAGVCNSMVSSIVCLDAPTTQIAGCLCSQVRASNINQALASVTSAESALSATILATVQQLMTQVRQESEGLQQRSNSLQSSIEQEQTRIFSELRDRVIESSLTPSTPAQFEQPMPVDLPPAFAPHAAISTPSASMEPHPIAAPSAPTEDELDPISPYFPSTAHLDDPIPIAHATPIMNNGDY